jgi:NADP-reducing hydrogenase subunit HndD
VERLEGGGAIPMFTSCCPSWVKFVKNYEPKLSANLTTALSPHIHAGFAYRTWWAERESIDPANIAVISIMPCTSKKDEVHEFAGRRAVDCVLTVRELVKLINERNIDFANLEESEGDSLSDYSGGAVIYGKSGGVMESALRVLKKKIDGETFENLILMELTEEGRSLREATIKIGSTEVKVAVISGPKNFRDFIESGRYRDYHYIEIMNCPGGCIGGGGQPLLPARPALEMEIMQNRRDLLQRLGGARTKRNALENKNATEYVEWVTSRSLENRLLMSPAF